MKRVFVLGFLCMSGALSAMGEAGVGPRNGLSAIGEAIESDFAGYKRSCVYPKRPQKSIVELLESADKASGQGHEMGVDGYRYILYLSCGGQYMGSIDIKKFEGKNTYEAVYLNKREKESRDIVKEDIASVHLCFKNLREKAKSLES